METGGTVVGVVVVVAAAVEVATATLEVVIEVAIVTAASNATNPDISLGTVVRLTGATTVIKLVILPGIAWSLVVTVAVTVVATTMLQLAIPVIKQVTLHGSVPKPIGRARIATLVENLAT